MITSSTTLRAGEIAVKKGFVKKDLVDKALSIQKVTKEPLLKILLDMGAIVDVQFAQILGEQW